MISRPVGLVGGPYKVRADNDNLTACWGLQLVILESCSQPLAIGVGGYVKTAFKALAACRPSIDIE